MDWYLTSSNSKFLPAFKNTGGDEITTGITIPIYTFLLNEWKIKPQEADHTLTITEGILVVDGGGDPFIDTDGNFTVRINYQQPVNVITVGSGLSSEEHAKLMLTSQILNGVNALQ